MQITSGWLKMPSDFMFPSVHPDEWMLGTGGTHARLIGGTFPLLFPDWELVGVREVLLHIGGYPSQLCQAVSNGGVPVAPR